MHIDHIHSMKNLSKLYIHLYVEQFEQTLEFDSISSLLSTLNTVPNCWNLRVARTLRQSSSIIKIHQNILFFRSRKKWEDSVNTGKDNLVLEINGIFKYCFQLLLQCLTSGTLVWEEPKDKDKGLVQLFQFTKKFYSTGA